MAATTAPLRKGMVEIPAGTFLMGSDAFYPEERPVHSVQVDRFWIDEHPVTNAQFRRFVKATGYVTSAERPIDPSDAPPGTDPDLLVPSSIVFSPPDGPVPFDDPYLWWALQPGASWTHPAGPASTLHGKERHPVVHVAHEDALAFAAWAGKALPTEAEWERAARGGLEGATFPWGDELAPRGRPMANTWQGEFPWENLALDGFEGTSPVKSFPPNGFGLYDVAGNVWEWTADRFTDDHGPAPSPCCGGSAPPVDPAPGDVVRRVIKGGSHLCAPNYCLRYRPAARQGHAVDSSTSHLGFRCVVRS